MPRLATSSLALFALSLLASQCSSAGVTVVYDFVELYSEAHTANALNPGAGTSAAGGIQKPSLFLHPIKGETTATYAVSMPEVGKTERLLLVFSAGLRDGLKTDDPEHPFDGVRFALRIDGKKQFAADLKETKWLDGAVDLTSKAGKRIEVVFVTSPNRNSNYDWAAWGQPRILRLSSSILDQSGRAPTGKGIVAAHASDDGASLEIVPLDAAGKTLGRGQSVPLTSGRVAAAGFDYTDLQAAAVQVIASGKGIEDIAVYKFNPDVEIVSFGPSSPVVFAGKPAEFRCVVKNVGEGVLEDATAAEALLSVEQIPDPGAGTSKPALHTGTSTASEPIGTLCPGEEKTITWPSAAVPDDGAFAASVTITGKDIEELSAYCWGAVSSSPAAVPLTAEKAESKELPDGTVILQSPSLRMTFLKGRAGYTGWMISIPKGDEWQSVATGAPLGKVVTGGEAGSEPITYQLYPRDLKLVNEPGKPPAVLFSAAHQIGSAQCRFEWSFTLAGSGSRVVAAHSMTAEQPVELLHFSGPTVYAGDRGFGGVKDDGLFPGLEYLLSESSSGTENASPPYNLRTVPHPNKITIPLMAVRSGDTLVALEWDPRRKWDGSADRPAAVFASPNFLDGQDNHKMGLFAPSVPDWTRENEQIASKSYTLAAGKTIRLEADIIVKPDSTSILDAVDGWLARHGVPEPPKMDKKYYEIMDLCNQAFLGSAWDESAKAWKHTNTGPVSFDPVIATYLWHLADNLRDAEKRQKIMDIVRPAVEKARDGLELDIALHAGGVDGALKRMADNANGLMAAQREDGSWPFAPDAKHKILGKPGDTSSGFSATHAAGLLRYALITGDAKAEEAGLKALKYLDSQKRPEGAQTWELQLHVPDILASSRLVDAYLCGYQLTFDKTYLDKAVYWAKSGLPFVYLWNTGDRPTMRYGTIPVFGATWFDGQPWFGVCVQWCGLEYAYSIARLSDFDDSVPWAKIAEGILNCAIQQQEYITARYPADVGMYPDAFSVIKGEEEYHWDLNPRGIARLLLRQIGADGFPYTYTVADSRGNSLALTIPAQGGKLEYQREWLRFNFRAPHGAVNHAVLAGVYAPNSVGINKTSVVYVEDIEKVQQGYQCSPETLISLIKYQTWSDNQLTFDLLAHEMTDFRRPKESSE